MKTLLLNAVTQKNSNVLIIESDGGTKYEILFSFDSPVGVRRIGGKPRVLVKLPYKTAELHIRKWIGEEDAVEISEKALLEILGKLFTV